MAHVTPPSKKSLLNRIGHLLKLAKEESRTSLQLADLTRAVVETESEADHLEARWAKMVDDITAQRIHTVLTMRERKRFHENALHRLDKRLGTDPDTFDGAGDDPEESVQG